MCIHTYKHKYMFAHTYIYVFEGIKLYFLIYFFVQRFHKHISFTVNYVKIFNRRKLTAGYLKVLQTQTEEKKIL